MSFIERNLRKSKIKFYYQSDSFFQRNWVNSLYECEFTNPYRLPQRRWP